MKAFKPVLGLILASFVSFTAGLVSAATPPDEFIFNSQSEPETLDPQRVTASNDQQLVFNLFEGLITRAQDYVTLKPAIASKWDISKDKKTYTFHIRPNLKWSNGDPMTMEQIRDSFIRAISPTTTNQYIQWYADNVDGVKDFIKNFNTPDKKKFEEKVGIKLSGKDKIEFHLNKPSISFLQYFSQPAFFVVHPSMIDPNSTAWHTPAKFVVNGPFKIVEWTVNKRVVLERNPYYRDVSDVRIKRVVGLLVNDEHTTLNLYRAGQIDWTAENTISSTLVPSLQARTDFHLIPSFGTYLYVFNIKHKPFDDVRVRRALSIAIQRGEITDKVIRAGQVPTNRLVPPGVKGYKPQIDPPAPFEKQVEKAKQLLAEAGFPDGKKFPEVTLMYNTTEGHRRIAEAVQQMWKKYLGINVKLQNMEWKVLLKEQEAKNFDIVRLSWIGDVPDPANMLDSFLSDSGTNYSNWGSAEYDKLVRDSASVTDAKKRFKMLEKAEKILLDEAPIAPIYHYVFYSLMSPRIEGFQPNMFGMYQFKYFSKK